MTEITGTNTKHIQPRRIFAAILGFALMTSTIATAEGAAVAAEGAQVSGTVTLDTAEGAPAVGIVVQAFLRNSDPAWTADPEYPTAATTTGADGSYTLATPYPGFYLVVAVPSAGDGRAPAFEPSVAVTTSSPDVDLTLVAGGALSGTVVSPSGTAVSGALVTVSLPETGSQFQWSATTESNGAYSFDSLPVGEYTASAHADAYDEVQIPVTIPTSQAIDDFVVAILPHASISGRVTSSTDLNQGLEGIVVTRHGVSTTTAADGTWTLNENQDPTTDMLAFSDPTQD